jgi:pimeloyl-ACP methyl ester carboxylesterase
MDLPTLAWLALALAALFLVAARWHYVFWTRRFTVAAEYAERHDLVTADGVPITLHRLPPPQTPDRPPVLLVHGIAANHRNVDAVPDRSLARFLGARGRDVWLLTLRSAQPGLSRAQKKKLGFAAMVEHDLPHAIELVLDRTRAPSLDYVGFSMGGMLLYAALGRTVPVERISRVALIGSPGRVAPPFPLLRIFRRMPRWLLPALWLRLGARMVAFAVELFRTPLHHFIYNPDNVERGATARALVNLIEDVPSALGADFTEWALSDGAIRIDGARVLDGLATVETPAVFYAGARDRLASPAAVREAYEAWGKDRSEVEKSFHVLGRASGAEHDYAHGDLAIGRGLVKDLFEPLGAFLR